MCKVSAHCLITRMTPFVHDKLPNADNSRTTDLTSPKDGNKLAEQANKAYQPQFSFTSQKHRFSTFPLLWVVFILTQHFSKWSRTPCFLSLSCRSEVEHSPVVTSKVSRAAVNFSLNFDEQIGEQLAIWPYTEHTACLRNVPPHCPVSVSIDKRWYLSNLTRAVL